MRVRRIDSIAFDADDMEASSRCFDDQGLVATEQASSGTDYRLVPDPITSRIGEKVV